MEASLQPKTGRIHGCTRTLRKMSDSSCTAGAVHTWPLATFCGSATNGRFCGYSDRTDLLGNCSFLANCYFVSAPIAVAMCNIWHSGMTCLVGIRGHHNRSAMLAVDPSRS